MVLASSGWVAATVMVVGGVVWLRPYPATAEAVAAITGVPGVAVSDGSTGIVLAPEEARAGFVFQPGARVDARAYVPMLTRVAQAGYLVVIVKQPLGIGFLAVDAPTAARRDHPAVSTWAVGGHSLGGVVAASYAAKSEVAGLVLWASYPSSSLADRTGLLVTSIYGTEDGLTTRAKLDSSKAMLPPTTSYVAIRGAIHAYFGDYGLQAGDGAATVSREIAQDAIVAATVALLERL